MSDSLNLKFHGWHYYNKFFLKKSIIYLLTAINLSVHPHTVYRLSDCIAIVLPLKINAQRCHSCHCFSFIFRFFEWFCREIKDASRRCSESRVNLVQTRMLCDKLTASWDKLCLKTSISLGSKNDITHENLWQIINVRRPGIAFQ